MCAAMRSPAELAVAGDERLVDRAMLVDRPLEEVARGSGGEAGCPAMRWIVRTIVRPTSLPDAFITIA